MYDLKYREGPYVGGNLGGVIERIKAAFGKETIWDDGT